MNPRPTVSTMTDTLFPSTTLCRSQVGQLPRHGGKEEEGQDEQAGSQRAERRFGPFVAIDAIDHEQHHRGLVEIVVEGVEKLGDEQGQKSPLAHKMRGDRKSVV